MNLMHRQPKRSSKTQGRALGFEHVEDRLMMSAVPVSPASSAEDGLEGYAGDQVKLFRDFMTKVYGLAKPGPATLNVTPFARLIDGNLVVYGTNANDVIKVQEYPPLYAKGVKVKDGEVVVDVRYGTGRQSGHYNPPAFKRTDIYNNTIFAYGADGTDNIEFISLVAGSQMRLYADGGKGTDTLTGGPQGDFLDGGVQDVSKDTIHGGFGNDIIAGGGGDDLLFGDADDDLLWGEAGIDTLRGGSGNDDLFGGADNDKLYGDSENDWLYGGLGKDTLNGEAGADYLDGGQDGIKDTLVGGTQGDRFRVDGSVSNNKDKPQKFNPDEGDVYVTGSSAKATALATTQGGSLAALDSAFDVGLRPTLRRTLLVG